MKWMDKYKIIADNGKGIPHHVKEKLLNNIQITSGKNDGHGIGFRQVWNTITNSQENIDIQSQEGQGTQIILNFPKADSPAWMAQTIQLNNNSQIIILDDDDSIHDAWEIRFEKVAPDVPRYHFKQGRDVLNYINKLTSEDKENVFLLSDYELLNQDLNGLDVIEQSCIKHSILVTSHHNNPDIQNRAKLLNTTILPKPLASFIKIQISNHDHIPIKKQFKKVNLVFLDDDKTLTEVILSCMVKDRESVDVYHKPQDLLDSIAHYDLTTTFLIDNQYTNENIRGFAVAEKLYHLGYSKLYLLTGEYFISQDDIPDYLQIVNKQDYPAIAKLFENIQDKQ